MRRFWVLLVLLFHLIFKAPELNARENDVPSIQSDNQVYYLKLENHVFTPSQLNIPAYRKIKLIILNKDSVAEEFDSFDLNREKMIFPGKKALIYIGPLSPGRYEYFGEYNPNSARGTIVAKEVMNAD